MSTGLPFKLGTFRLSGRICLGAFLRSSRPRGPGKAFKNVGGEAPHIYEGLPGLPGPARLQKCTRKSGQTAFRHPACRTPEYMLKSGKAATGSESASF